MSDTMYRYFHFASMPFLRHAERSLHVRTGPLHLHADAAVVRHSLFLEKLGHTDEKTKKQFADNVQILEKRLRQLVPSLDASSNLSISQDARNLLNFWLYDKICG